MTQTLCRVDAVFLDHLSQDIRGTNSSAVWRYLIAYKNLLRSIENIGIAVVYGIRLIFIIMITTIKHHVSDTMRRAMCLRISIFSSSDTTLSDLNIWIRARTLLLRYGLL